MLCPSQPSLLSRFECIFPGDSFSRSNMRRDKFFRYSTMSDRLENLPRVTGSGPPDGSISWRDPRLSPSLPPPPSAIDWAERSSSFFFRRLSPFVCVLNTPTKKLSVSLKKKKERGVTPPNRAEPGTRGSGCLNPPTGRARGAWNGGMSVSLLFPQPPPVHRAFFKDTRVSEGRRTCSSPTLFKAKCRPYQTNGPEVSPTKPRASPRLGPTVQRQTPRVNSCPEQTLPITLSTKPPGPGERKEPTLSGSPPRATQPKGRQYRAQHRERIRARERQYRRQRREFMRQRQRLSPRALEDKPLLEIPSPQALETQSPQPSQPMSSPRAVSYPLDTDSKQIDRLELCTTWM